MPRCLGGFENGIHISKVDMIIEGSNPPIAEMGGGAAATEVDHAVARQIVAQIPNGACLQLGIGGMPNAVGSLIAESDLKILVFTPKCMSMLLLTLPKLEKSMVLRKNLNKGLPSGIRFCCRHKEIV